MYAWRFDSASGRTINGEQWLSIETVHKQLRTTEARLRVTYNYCRLRVADDRVDYNEELSPRGTRGRVENERERDRQRRGSPEDGKNKKAAPGPVRRSTACENRFTPIGAGTFAGQYAIIARVTNETFARTGFQRSSGRVTTNIPSRGCHDGNGPALKERASPSPNGWKWHIHITNIPYYYVMPTVRYCVLHHDKL